MLESASFPATEDGFRVGTVAFVPRTSPPCLGQARHQALHSLMRSQFPERKFLLWHSTKALVGVWLQRPRALLAGAKQVCKMGIIGDGPPEGAYEFDVWLGLRPSISGIHEDLGAALCVPMPLPARKLPDMRDELDTWSSVSSHPRGWSPRQVQGTDRSKPSCVLCAGHSPETPPLQRVGELPTLFAATSPRNLATSDVAATRLPADHCV